MLLENKGCISLCCTYSLVDDLFYAFHFVSLSPIPLSVPAFFSLVTTSWFSLSVSLRSLCFVWVLLFRFHMQMGPRGIRLSPLGLFHLTPYPLDPSILLQMERFRFLWLNNIS